MNKQMNIQMNKQMNIQMNKQMNIQSLLDEVTSEETKFLIDIISNKYSDSGEYVEDDDWYDDLDEDGNWDYDGFSLPWGNGQNGHIWNSDI